VVPETKKINFKNVTLTSAWPRINMNFFVENLPSTVIQFKIAYGESPDSLTNEVTTFTLDKIKRTDGSYNWYIDNLMPRNYSFKIFWVQSGGLLVADMSSEVLSATVWKNECTIGNIGNIETRTLSDKTILSWDALTWAVSYNIYRVSAAKDYELLENVTANSYTLFLSSWALQYQDFAVRGLCDDKTESSVPAFASQVQTWPWLLSIIIALSALLGIFFVRRNWS
jgi:hypothetical protein